MSNLASVTASRLRIAAAVPLQHLSASTKPPGNDYNYDEAYKHFTWDVPEGFNFAQDVIDKHAAGELKDRIALLLVGEDGKTETKLSYSDLSRRSREVAVSLDSLGKISRAVTVLPKVHTSTRPSFIVQSYVEKVIIPGLDCLISFHMLRNINEMSPCSL